MEQDYGVTKKVGALIRGPPGATPQLAASAQLGVVLNVPGTTDKLRIHILRHEVPLSTERPALMGPMAQPPRPTPMSPVTSTSRSLRGYLPMWL